MAKWWKRGVADPLDDPTGDPVPEAYVVRANNPVVAAANRMRPDAGVMRQFRIPTEAWQKEAWRQYDITGELRYAATWKGNAFSRCRLMVCEVLPTGERGPETDDPRVIEIMRSFMGAPARQAQMLMLAGTHFTVPGEFYIVAIVQPDGTFKWCIHSNDEIRAGGLAGKRGSFVIDTGDGHPIEYVDGENSMLIRVHRPHARKTWLADSPARVAIPVLREIEQIMKYKFAIMDSRLAGAGILLLPNDLDFPDPEEEPQPGEGKFLALLAEAMMASIKDRGDARAVVPIVVQGPKESLGTAQWLVSPSTELSAQASEDLDRAIRRLAIDMDMPPEALLGLSGANDWASSTIDEAGIKLHIEPDLSIICDAITQEYLGPALREAGIDPRKFVVWFDPAGLVLRPNRAQDAKDLYALGVISAETLRHACGFNELDAPKGKEAAIAALKVVLMAAPGMGDAIARALVTLLGLEEFGITAADIAPDPAGGTPNTGDQPDPAAGDGPGTPTQDPKTGKADTN